MHSHTVDTVARLLISQPTLQLPINPCALHHQKTIYVTSVNEYLEATASMGLGLEQHEALQDGLTIVTEHLGETVYVILFNDDVVRPDRRNFTVAHELGHIYLSHRTDSPRQEKAADIFAAELLAPRCMLWELHQRFDFVPPELVQEIFGLSASMAKRRLDHLYPKPKRNTAEHTLWEKSKELLPTPEDTTLLLD